MDLLTPKQLKDKIGIDDRMHKEKTLKTLLAYNKAKQVFNELRIKIKSEKENVLLGYNEFTENKNKEKQILYKEIEGLEQRRDEMFKPLVEKEKAIDLKITEKKELFNDYEKLEKTVDEKIEKNQVLLDNAEKAKSYCEMNEKNNVLKKEELSEKENGLNNKENNINNLTKQNLAQIKIRNEEAEKKENDINAKEIIVKSNQEVVDLEKIELRHIRIKMQDEREALNRAKQEIYGRR